MTGVAFSGGALLAIVFLLGTVAGAVVCSMAGWLGRRDAQPAAVAVPAPPPARARPIKRVEGLPKSVLAEDFGFAWHDADGRRDMSSNVFTLRTRRATDGIGRGTGTDAA